MASSDSMRRAPVRAAAQAMRRMGAAHRRRWGGEGHQHERNVAAEAVGDGLEIAGVHHQAEHHHVHREEGGDAGAQQQVFALGVAGALPPVYSAAR